MAIDATMVFDVTLVQDGVLFFLLQLFDLLPLLYCDFVHFKVEYRILYPFFSISQLF